MTADDVLEESQLPIYNSFVRHPHLSLSFYACVSHTFSLFVWQSDYLRMVIQYVRPLPTPPPLCAHSHSYLSAQGYVVMFSVVWPFCALAALVNNLIHIRNSFNKLFILQRRPVPRKANSIGQWEKMLFTTLILAVFVVVGLICVSSGELEYFMDQCTTLERFQDGDLSMNPDFSCLDISSRFLVALVLEHAALLLVYLVFDNISDTPASVRTSFQRKKELIRQAICGHANASSTPATPAHKTLKSPLASHLHHHPHPYHHTVLINNNNNATAV